jgi:hypothetical protein
MFGTVLQLGKHCQNVLSEYIEEDERLAHLRWIQNVRCGQFTKASSGLMSLSSDGIASFGEKSGKQSLEGRKLVLSLAKLGAMASEDNSLQVQNIRTFAQESLDLCTAQEILGDMVDSYDVSDRIMDARSLMKLALELADSLDDKDEKYRACLAGLSIAKSMNSDSSIDTSSRHAHVAKVWALSINVDTESWLELLEQWNLLSDNDKITKLEDTVFYNVARKYYSDADVSKRDEVGFTVVQSEVLRLLAINQRDLSELLTAAIRICRASTQ